MKPRYKYNHATKKWDEMFVVNTDISVFTGLRNPNGSLVVFTLPRISPLVNYHLSQHDNNSCRGC